MISDTQMPKAYRDVIDKQLEIYEEKRSITSYNSIPDTSDIPLDNQTHLTCTRFRGDFVRESIMESR